MLSRLPSPVIFAHRGASAYLPENTLAAFELAHQQGADGIELDVKRGFDIFNNLKDQKSFTLDLVRGGSTQTFEYEIR